MQMCTVHTEEMNIDCVKCFDKNK